MKINDRVVKWLISKSIEVEIVNHNHPDAFVPYVWLDRGKLVINPSNALVEDVLHEAGHLACIPSRFRHLTAPGPVPGAALKAALKEYCDTHSFMDDQGHEDPVWRSIIQMGDCEATAWAYAASRHLELPAENLFAPRDDGSEAYDGEGPDIWLALDMGSYPGINGLQAAGFCRARSFPQMLRWLAP